MMSAWHGTKKTDPPEVRFSHTLREAAVSVTITSVSDILAFAVGSWNSLPGVRLFCIYTAVAFAFELIYQCTFYAAAMALFAKAECEGRHCITLRKAVALEEAGKIPWTVWEIPLTMSYREIWSLFPTRRLVGGEDIYRCLVMRA